MAKHLKKKCICHGKQFLVVKKSWKQMRRRKQEPVCLSELFKGDIAYYAPYIPLLQPVAIK